MYISRSQLKLLALILAFFGPLFLAMFMYFNPYWFATPAPESHGKLITPPQSLAAFSAVSRTGEALPPDLLHNKWTLLYWNTATCDLSCEASLFKMRQVRLSLSKDVDRTQTVYLISAPPDSPDPVLKRHPRLIMAYLPPGAKTSFRQQISAQPKGDIYIIDPLGNLIMRYSSDTTSKGLLKDLKKLLRVSRIG